MPDQESDMVCAGLSAQQRVRKIVYINMLAGNG